LNSNKNKEDYEEKPEDWDIRSIGEVAIVVGGGTPSTKIGKFWNGTVPWITPKDLSKNMQKYISRGERNISQDGLCHSNAKLFPENSVIVSTRAPIGYVAISKNEMTVNQGCHALIPKESTTAEYLYYLIKDNVHYLQLQGSGSTFGELSGKNLKELIFIFPKK